MFIETGFLDIPEEEEIGFDELEKSYQNNDSISIHNNANFAVIIGDAYRTVNNITSSTVNESDAEENNDGSGMFLNC